MERLTRWTFLVILVISLCHLETSEACQPYKHPQTHFCNSEFFAVVNVTEIHEGNNSQVAYVDVHEIFRMTGETLKYYMKKKQLRLWSKSLAECGSLDLTLGEMWVVGGIIRRDTLYVSSCGFAQLWSKVTPILRDNFKNSYHSGCACRIWDCQWCHNSVFKSPDRMTCILDSSPGRRFCQDLFGICRTNYSHTACSWNPSEVYEKCLAELDNLENKLQRTWEEDLGRIAEEDFETRR